MCVIIHKPVGAELKEEYLAEGFDCNDDGWGIVAIDRENIHQPITVRKEVSHYKKFLKQYKRFKDKELVIHFRIKTHGAVNRENAHPYLVTQGVWVAHNGILRNIDIDDDTKSDTWQLAQNIKPVLEANPSLLHNPKFLTEMGKLIGSNKLVFADKDGVYFVNKALGIERDGCWFSNNTAFPNQHSTYTNWDDWGNRHGSRQKSYYGYGRPMDHLSAARSIDTGQSARISYGDPDLPTLYAEMDNMSADEIYNHIKTYPSRVAFLLYSILDNFNFPNWLEKTPTPSEAAEIEVLTAEADKIYESIHSSVHSLD